MKHNRTHIRRYRFNDHELKLLESLKLYRIREPDFVRMAIEEKYQRDLPELKQRYSGIPF